jgi:hypothetical protein
VANQDDGDEEKHIGLDRGLPSHGTDYEGKTSGRRFKLF